MHYNVNVNIKTNSQMLSGTDVPWAHNGRLGGTNGGGETVPYVGAGHWEGTPSELRPASFDGSGSSTGSSDGIYI